MPVSYAEQTPLTCPNCATQFDATIWMLLDTGERPDLAENLLEGTLNVVTCPNCRYSDTAGGPLLIHDPGGRRVYFAAPAGAAEHLWREQAQALLYVLIGSLPEEARQPYLGDVQVEVDMDGVRRAMARRGRRFAPRLPEEPLAPEQMSVPPVPAAPSLPVPEAGSVVAAIEELLSADTPAELIAIAARRPEVTTIHADEVFEQLIVTARAQGEHDVAHALVEARLVLRDLRAGQSAEAGTRRVHTGEDGMIGTGVAVRPPPTAPAMPHLAEAAYQALLLTDGPDSLHDAVCDYPVLLEPWVDDELAWRVDHALDDGNERLAQLIEAYRDALAQMRAELTSADELGRAIDALLRAGHAAEMLLAVIGEYPALLTEAAQDALFELAAGARMRGDAALAEHAIECRAMLRSVREGLQEEL